MKEHIPSLSNLTSPQFGKPPKQQNEILQELGQPHVDSYNFFAGEGLRLAIADLDPVEFKLTSTNDDQAQQRITLRLIDARLGSPQVPYGVSGVKRTAILPSECRQRQATYKGRLVGKILWHLNGREMGTIEKDFGEIPIMLKSSKCHLNTMSPQQLVAANEHEEEWGGYFIIKGLDRLVRMLLMTRRNYPIALSRSGWRGRGPLFSDLGVTIRCVKADETTTTNVLHYVTDGTVKVMFSHRKVLYFANLMLILKCLMDYTDQHIFELLLQGHQGQDNFNQGQFSSAIQLMQRDLHMQGLHTHNDCLNYLGKLFRVKFQYDLPSECDDVALAKFILQKCILIHLNSDLEKFQLLCHMIGKLFLFAAGKIKPESVDAPMMQEVLLGGHLMLKIVKEKCQSYLQLVRTLVLKKLTNYTNAFETELTKVIRQSGGFEGQIEGFLATGNLQSTSGLGLMQDKGLTIVPENINRMRFMSHFRSVHRGAFFQEMRTTEVRQLLPDAWGFICPVHTPDGAPCGLLNHLSLNCKISTGCDSYMRQTIEKILFDLSLSPLRHSGDNAKKTLIVMMDGRILGVVDASKGAQIMRALRKFKVFGVIDQFMEIVHIEGGENQPQMEGLYLFTGPTRLMRPVLNLEHNKIEYIGTFEQVYLDIAVHRDEMHENTTHLELVQTGFLSNLAQLIPMPDCNQSPRNMYQCQMGKQTMGTPTHLWATQAETKLYRLQTPTSPLFRPVHYDHIAMDPFAMGTNAIVAVISYTGYDMEDAMIINKSSFERGFGYGTVYKSEFIELESDGYFCRDPNNASLEDYLETDGLPFIGRRIEKDEPLYCFYNKDKQAYQVIKASVKETCFVDSVRQCGNFGGGGPSKGRFNKSVRMVCLTYRLPRPPSIGDKFASRSGQKGICSRLWPAIDLPFTATGVVPDIIFNPHGFPSRMTIAMMIELLAGKAAALHGHVYDATPFRFSENDPNDKSTKNSAIDYFGELLSLAGYNSYGHDVMYSGLDGREMNARIYCGVVHYQRLRHMVSDKYQVRSTGAIDALTRQPLKGRRRGGGIRFGEMERDGVASHGAVWLLHERVQRSSDLCLTQVCTKCKSLIGIVTVVIGKSSGTGNTTEMHDECRLCKSSAHIAHVQIPYIYRFFATQMAACNIIIKYEDNFI